MDVINPRKVEQRSGQVVVVAAPEVDALAPAGAVDVVGVGPGQVM